MKRRKRAPKASRPAARVARARVGKPAAKKKPRIVARAPSMRETFEREIRRLRSARSKLERRLTAAVQEIGTLRQFELRATMLEGELQKLRRETEERIRTLESNPGGASAAPALS
jgi:hypothetical protein